MTKTNIKIFFLFILSFLLFNLAIVFNIFFSKQIFDGLVISSDQFLSELFYLLLNFGAIICLTAGIFLYLKDK
jgi:hypothetical protein